EVLVSGSVAVAMTRMPGVSATGRLALKLALPDPSVVTLAAPRKYCAPLELEKVGWAKNSNRYVRPATLFSEPRTEVLPAVVAEASTGKFCKLFGPLSASLLSFGVGPSRLRSMGMLWLLKMTLPRTA